MPFDFLRKPSSLLAPKVLAIDFRPAAIPNDWNKTDDLIQKYITTMRQASGDKLVHQLKNKVTVADYPVLLDGRRYNDTTWTQAVQNDQKAFRDSHGNYMLADYMRIMQDFNILSQIQNKQIDEVWMFGGPYFGFYESRMVGKGAFWCNAPAIEQNTRRFVMMGFNYQRDVKEMVHDFGHRAESILARQFGATTFLQQLYSPQPPAAAAMSAPTNDYEQFLLTTGTVHRKPGGAEYGQDEIACVTALKPTWLPSAVDPNKIN
ncbi:MAG: hypothetical protein HY258_10560 [Chloroflexi bacterium]|nr:hypothetical protein [Chloroflexota bacterium]